MIEILTTFFENVFAFDSAKPLLFTQFYFWAFLFFVLLFLSVFRDKILLRNAYLFLVSLFFYYKTSGLFTFLLLFVIISNFLLAKKINILQSKLAKKSMLIFGVFTNLTLLSYFKYAYFLTDLINNLLGLELEVFDIFAFVGNGFSAFGKFRVDEILLPVGVSFFIFQAISYLVDVFRAKIQPVKNLLDFGFYLSFFPQLVAGPIVRASEFIPQLHRPFALSRRLFALAIFWCLSGLVKKILFADYLAVNFIDRVFENPLLFSGFENLFALFAYSLEVYADFSGYTDIAIGVAMLLGFHLPKNFNSPYKAQNAADFWRRWHISLSTWLRDYLYIPLGGNRKASAMTFLTPLLIAIFASMLSKNIFVGILTFLIILTIALIYIFNKNRRLKISTSLNSLATMLLGGLWHGASFNFIIWGGLNGIGILIFKFWKDKSPFFRLWLLVLLTAFLGELCLFFPAPIFNLLFIWSLILLLGGLIIYMFIKIFGKKNSLLPKSWAILQTFVFISFTRLFFRSGSNLDPAKANQEAWQTAKNMVHSIGSNWDFSLIPQIISEYSSIFIVFFFGMTLHLLPENFCRRTRIAFTKIPLWCALFLIVATVFLLYQFISSDLQKFIYFQF